MNKRGVSVNELDWLLICTYPSGMQILFRRPAMKIPLIKFLCKEIIIDIFQSYNNSCPKFLIGTWKCLTSNLKGCIG
jgi:hypothetical protein